MTSQNSRHLILLPLTLWTLLAASTTTMAQATPVAVAAPVPAVLVGKVNTVVDADTARLIAIFKDLHQHPEIGFTETRTAGIVARELRSLGFNVTEGIGKTGVVGVAEKILEEQAQVIDGVDNLAYWTGKSGESARNDFLYYYESDIKAVRIGPWKLHFATSENYYDTYTKQKFPVFFNLRMDPFESFDEVGDCSGIVQRKQWLNEPLQELLNEHIQTLIDHPPVQAATSFDFSELMRSMGTGAN